MNTMPQSPTRTTVQTAEGAGKKVVVAMSGGVDSSVTAALLKDRGYEVVGCFMRNGATAEGSAESDDDDAEAEGPAMGSSSGQSCSTQSTSRNTEHGGAKQGPRKAHKQGCCSVNDAQDARLVAAMLDIPFYVVNFQRDFGRIMDYFTAEYNAGRTPNPCVRCNDWLKFGKLHDYARSIDADFVATGHYARIRRGHSPEASSRGRGASPAGAQLRQGVDADKDQSYVLFGTPAEQLDHMLLPVGDYQKEEVRQIADEYDLPTFDKPDSQEICFVPDNDYAGMVERRTPGGFEQGEIRDTEGHLVGTHKGHQRFTHGQRRGLGLALGYPIYVVEKDAQANTITVGSKDQLLARGALASQTNWLTQPPPAGQWRPCRVKVRYNSPPVNGSYRLGGEQGDNEDQLDVRFDQSLPAVTPGQAIVCYGEEETALAGTVLGGGWIDAPIRE